MSTLATLRPIERRVFYLLVMAAAVLVVTLIGRSMGNGQAPGSVSILAPGVRPARTAASLTTEELVARLRQSVQADPENAAAYAQLGLALLQQVRETADPALYAQAESALQEALKRDPRQLDALIGQGLLALARHDFGGALGWGQRAYELMPYRAEALGIIVDAQIELGRYEAAVESAQAMVDLRPDIASYSRVSYIREIHGDTAGAITAMQAAVDAGPPGAEATAWASVQLGHLYFNDGDLSAAEASYQEALVQRPDYPFARAGLARIWTARGNAQSAIDALEELTARLPLPEFLITLGQLYEAAGQIEQAERQYDLVRVIQQLNADAGMDVDLELALFEADHGDPAAALETARSAYERRPTIFAADALAWAHYRNGDFDQATRRIDEALRLGTRSAPLFYHAGMIRAAQGDDAAAADYLSRALALNPHFDLLQAEVAREALASLEE